MLLGDVGAHADDEGADAVVEGRRDRIDGYPAHLVGLGLVGGLGDLTGIGLTVGGEHHDLVALPVVVEQIGGDLLDGLPGRGVATRLLPGEQAPDLVGRVELRRQRDHAGAAVAGVAVQRDAEADVRLQQGHHPVGPDQGVLHGLPPRVAAVEVFVHAAALIDDELEGGDLRQQDLLELGARHPVGSAGGDPAVRRAVGRRSRHPCRRVTHASRRPASLAPRWRRSPPRGNRPARGHRRSMDRHTRPPLPRPPLVHRIAAAIPHPRRRLCILTSTRVDEPSPA